MGTISFGWRGSHQTGEETSGAAEGGFQALRRNWGRPCRHTDGTGNQHEALTGACSCARGRLAWVEFLGPLTCFADLLHHRVAVELLPHASDRHTVDGDDFVPRDD